MSSLRVRHVEASSAALAGLSRTALDAAVHEAMLIVGRPTDDAVVLGAYQRRSELMGHTSTKRVFARGSGGGAAEVGPGTLWLQLSLQSPSALTDATPDNLLNRYVRPLLRVLTSTLKTPVNYFGRDWVSARKHPVALVGFAHDSTQGHALFEALVAVSTPLSLADRVSYLGKSPTTLERLAGAAMQIRGLANAVVDAYGALADVTHASTEAILPEASETCEVPDEPPWLATRMEGIGLLGAGPDSKGRFHVGGEFMASRDAMAQLEARLATLSENAGTNDIERAVEESLGALGVTTFGLRTLASLREVIVEARQRQR